jgi:LPPG:FO 2-phospho-L-lactate transferase
VSAGRASRTQRPSITVLAGGVGAARFLRGLTRVTDPRTVTVIGNTGDDEEFFGLHVAPDLDTVLYTLAGRVDPAQGWGIRDDTFACLDALGGLGLPGWFRLGDADLATHLLRTAWLRAGRSLSDVTARLAAVHGVRTRLLPMTDDRVRTFVHTGAGRLPFQAYLVRDRARGRVRRIEIAGVGSARPAPGVLAALRTADAIVIAPSNPLVSVGPILGVRGVRAALARRRARAAAICPLVGGRPVKGPLHRMLRGLGLEVSPRGVARCYRGLIDVFVLDRRDAAWAPRVEALGMRAVVTDTLMRTPARAGRLARVVLRALDARRA